MKCFTLSSLGIKCREGKILVGESGRGRKLVAVPLPPQSVLESDLKDSGRSDLLVECQGNPTSALVYIPDQSGFRGGWRLRDARTPEEWDKILARGAEHERAMDRGRALKGKKTSDGWDVHPSYEEFLAASGGHTVPMGGGPCPACPPLPKERPHQAKVIAEGASAQGDAGRMGGGPEYLLVLSHGQAVELVRSGRLYGAPSVIRLECVAGKVIEANPRAEAAEREAAAKWDALADEVGGEPTEATLSWGGGSNRHRAHNWACRPHLRTNDGAVIVFEGKSIPGVVEVLEDISVHSGYARGRCEGYRVALANGVTFIGNAVPDSEEVAELSGSMSSTFASEEPKKFGTSIGDALRDAGM